MKRVLAVVILAGAAGGLIRRRRRPATIQPCPTCRGGGVNWSEPSLAQYGKACLRHRLFWAYISVSDCASWYPLPLSHVNIPIAYRGIPAFRNAAGWTGPT